MIVLNPEQAANMVATIKAFRLGMEGQANEKFSKMIGDFELLLPKLPSQKLNHLMAVLPEILAAQTRQDYLNIADSLEYRVAPLLISNPQDYIQLL